MNCSLRNGEITAKTLLGCIEWLPAPAAVSEVPPEHPRAGAARRSGKGARGWCMTLDAPCKHSWSHSLSRRDSQRYQLTGSEELDALRAPLPRFPTSNIIGFPSARTQNLHPAREGVLPVPCSSFRWALLTMLYLLSYLNVCSKSFCNSGDDQIFLRVQHWPYSVSLLAFIKSKCCREVAHLYHLRGFCLEIPQGKLSCLSSIIHDCLFYCAMVIKYII